MTNTYSTTERAKGKHLTAIERRKIAGQAAEKLSNREIARRIGVHHTTIANELARGKVEQTRKINGTKHSYFKYDPEYAQICYEQKRKKCHCPSKFH